MLRRTVAVAGLIVVAFFPGRATGVPNLEGVWANNTVTPFERPPQLARKPILTDADIDVLKERAARLFDGSGEYASGDDLFLTLLNNPAAHTNKRIPTGEYNQFWANDGLTFEHRTSQIIDPEDGRLPPYTEVAASELQARARERQEHPADNPEDRWLSERCLTFGTARVGFLQSRNNSYYRIVQAPKYVVLASEMIHEARVIPLDGRPHADSYLRFWSGDPRGRWEGPSLVIDSTNFTDALTLRLSPTVAVRTGHLHLVERLTLVDSDTMEYRATIDDPTVWVRPWTAVTTWRRSAERMFEYACHEANYSLTDILAGARAEERRR
jgi:hypothetical protein